jgi:hypothetical protein
MKRRSDWLERLTAYIEDVRLKPFDYTENHCGVFASTAVKLMTDEDPLVAIGVQFEDVSDYVDFMKDPQHPRKVVSKFLGYDALPPLLAFRGDVVVREGTHGDSLGICIDDRAAFLGENGLQFRALSECEGCWHI